MIGADEPGGPSPRRRRGVRPRGTSAAAGRDLEAAARPLADVATGPGRGADDLRDHELGQAAELRVRRHRRGQRAALAAYPRWTVGGLDPRDAAELLERLDGRLEAVGQRARRARS